MHPPLPAHAIELITGLLAITVLTPVLLAATIGLIIARERPAPIPQEDSWSGAGRPARGACHP